MSMDANASLEAYARLNSLRANRPEAFEVHEKWVTEFHAILDILESVSGQALANFRVPVPEVRPRITGVVPARTGRPSRVYRSSDGYCERTFLVMKIDGVLNYFSYQSQHGQRVIGFQPPSE